MFLFFFNDTATTEIYTLSLPDALPISARRTRSTCPSGRGRRCGSGGRGSRGRCPPAWGRAPRATRTPRRRRSPRSEEHTSELQSRQYLVCRLLLEKKKKNNIPNLTLTI